MAWNTLAGTLPVLGLNGMTHLADSHAMAAHLYQGAHDGPHHIAQKPVGRHREAPFAGLQLLPARSVSWQMFVFTSVPVLLKLVKSLYSSNT